MAKEFVINTSRVNCYGFRVLTSGIDISQYIKNPILLWMHRRAFEGENMPIGTVQNLRFEGDQLIGEPVFDMDDPIAAKIANKWEKGVIRMGSPGLIPLEYSEAPEYLLPGQTRPTVTRSKLEEISLADIGGNDDALQLYAPDGKRIELSTGKDNEFIPLLKQTTPGADDQPDAGGNNNENQKTEKMDFKPILLALGLAETATEQDALGAIDRLKTQAKEAATITLARITDAVDAAAALNPTLAPRREELITLGKTAGFDALKLTLGLAQPAVKPTDVINLAAGGNQPPAGPEKWADLTPETAADLKAKNRPEYIRLYKAEFGKEPQIDEK